MLSRLFIIAFWSPEGKGLTSWLLFVMLIVILLLSNLVSWDRCGTWLYWFLILAVFLTLWVKLYNNLFHQIRHVFCLMFWLTIRKQFNYDFLSRGREGVLLNILNESRKRDVRLWQLINCFLQLICKIQKYRSTHIRSSMYMYLVVLNFFFIASWACTTLLWPQ